MGSNFYIFPGNQCISRFDLITFLLSIGFRRNFKRPKRTVHQNNNEDDIVVQFSY